jgi:uncharacterized sporulation protein YeaH/YhbH (DUF444 family)
MDNNEYNPRKILEDNGFQTFYASNLACVMAPDGVKYYVSCNIEKSCFIFLMLVLATNYSSTGMTYLQHKGRKLLVDDHEVDYFMKKYGWERVYA